MSDDLISRKALINILNILKGVDKDWLLTINQIIDFIEDQPIAFDKEKVIEELENLKAQYFINIVNAGDERLGFAYKYVWNALNHAIEIVEKGGIE